MQEKLFNVFILFFCFHLIIAIDVSTVEELHKALTKARAGQTISISPVEYDYTEYESYNSYELYSSGTESSPITLTAQDPDDPPILRSPVSKEGVVLRIRGSYWIIDNIKVANGRRGILIENSSYNIIWFYKAFVTI